MYLHSNVAAAKLVTLIERIFRNPWSHHSGDCPSYCVTIFNKTATAQLIHRALTEAQVKKAFQHLGPKVSVAYPMVYKVLKLCTHFLPKFYYSIPSVKSFPLDHTLSSPSVLRCNQAMCFRRGVTPRSKSFSISEKGRFLSLEKSNIFSTLSSSRSVT